MPAQWTAEVVGKMHLHKITAVQLAEKIGWHPKYLSAVLNGKRQPKQGERRKERCIKNHHVDPQESGLQRHIF